MTSLLVCTRAFHFGGGMILAGVVAFRRLILLPACAGETGETWREFAPVFGKLNGLWIGSWVVLVISGFVWFGAVGAEMSGVSFTESLTGGTARTVLFQTQFGSVCQWRLGFALLLGLIMTRLTWRRWLMRRAGSALESAAGSLAFALVLSVAWTGHAAAGGPDLRWKIFADAAHLFAASIWPTGLLPFALFLGFSHRIVNPIALRPALEVTRRFSRLSFIIVWALIATGVVNACFIVGSFRGLVATDYGQILCLKLFLLILILGFAAWNRYRIMPILSDRAVAMDKGLIIPLFRSLQNFVLVEFILAVVIVFVVGFLGITPPPH